jgi:hypothetical protein
MNFFLFDREAAAARSADRTPNYNVAVGIAVGEG